jgi:phasin
MNETIVGATKAKTAKHITDPFGTSKYEVPKMEVRAEFREMTDKGVAHARDAYAKAKVASEEAVDLLENVYTTVAKGVTEYNLELIEIARTNNRAALDYAHQLLGVKFPSELIELSTAHMCKQFDIVSAQTRELYALVQELTADATEPIKTGMSKAFNKATSSRGSRNIGPITTSFRKNLSFPNRQPFDETPGGHQ